MSRSTRYVFIMSVRQTIIISAFVRRRLAFVTTGILLRRLTTGDDLSGVSHVIIVHLNRSSCVRVDLLWPDA